MTDDQVRTAIAVLRAYIDGMLATDLCDELDEAIEKAWNALCDQHYDPGDFETPLTQSW